MAQIEKMRLHYISIGYLIFTLWACQSQNNNSLQNKNEPEQHWSYEGETSPEHWSEIEKNSDCSGKYQSPINLLQIDAQKEGFPEKALALYYSDQTQLLDVVNNGHSVQFDFEKGDSIQYRDNIYQLSQIHFHEPAEHTINGIRYPIEIHLVHISKKSEFTVLSIMGQENEESQLFEFFESFLPIKEGQKKEIHQPTDLMSLFPEKKSFLTYQGSLTTPPCTENVNWIVFNTPIDLSLEEVLKLKKNMPLNNYRNEQPLNQRKVYLGSL